MLGKPYEFRVAQLIFAMKKTLTYMLVLIGLMAGLVLRADESSDRKDKGYVTGSFETTTNYYNKDLKTGAVVPDAKSGSNNYLKADYYSNRFSAGIQMEVYAPVLLGYNADLKGAALTGYYLDWTDEDFSITAGTFYEQFGSGLLFRSWEDRTLGLNNALIGARATYNLQDYASVKVLWGIPRLGTGVGEDGFFGFGLTKVNVAGADLSISLSDILGMQTASLSLEGSVLNRHEKVRTDLEKLGFRSNNIGWSGRVNFEYEGFFAKGEYVDAGKQIINTFMKPADGNAQLIEMGYNGRGLGLTVTGRRMKHMRGFRYMTFQLEILPTTFCHTALRCVPSTHICLQI